MQATRVALALVLATLIDDCQSKEPQLPTPVGVSNFNRNPPGVESATVRLLTQRQAEGNALLEVQFDQSDKRVSRSVPIQLDDREVLLRDDGANGDARAGDRVFSSFVELDLTELRTDIDRGLRLKSTTTPQPVFQGREMIGIEDTSLVRARFERLQLLRNVDSLQRVQARFNLFDLVPSVDPATIDPARSLVITDTIIVRDPTRTIDPCTGVGNPKGVWTFKHLVTEMVAGTGVDPADFVERWLGLWASNQLVSSGFIAAPRPLMNNAVVVPWPRTSSGKLDLDKGPFRLAAIVNRIDLGNNPAYGGLGNAGEGRFVFGIVDRNAPGCRFLPASVIFEYGVPRHTCRAVRNWGAKWLNLSSIAMGSAMFKDSLQLLTEEFVRANADPSKPNGSALNQLRTNEIAFSPVWELREFVIDSASHLLIELTTKQTPDETLNNTTVIRDYVNGNAADIKLDKHVVPDRFPATNPFMAATSRASSGQTNTHFRAPGITDNDARFHFSLNTCSACHIRETSTNGSPPGNTAFLHVDPEPMPAALSRFMTGATASLADSPDPFDVNDPVVGTTIHTFNDIERRRQKLAAIVGTKCLRFLLVPPRALLLQRPPSPLPERLPPIRDPRLNGINDPIRMTH